jgi:hypothetical protein
MQPTCIRGRHRSRGDGTGSLNPTGNAQDHLVVPDLSVLELSLSSLGYQALIGRDLLARCRFLYDGPGNAFRLTY